MDSGVHWSPGQPIRCSALHGAILKLGEEKPIVATRSGWGVLTLDGVGLSALRFAGGQRTMEQESPLRLELWCWRLENFLRMEK